MQVSPGAMARLGLAEPRPLRQVLSARAALVAAPAPAGRERQAASRGDGRDRRYEVKRELDADEVRCSPGGAIGHSG